MQVLVVGATGQTGKHIVEDLKKRNIAVTAIVRNLEKAQELLPSEVNFVLGDVTQPDTIAEAMSRCSVLICATGAAPSFDFTGPFQVDYQGTKNLVDLAKANNIEHFILVSSLCVSKFFHPLNLFWLILYWKQQAENYIQQSGLTYTIVRPGGLKNEDNTENIVMSSADTLFEGSIPRQKVAQVCVEALFNNEAKNKIVEIVTQPDSNAQTWQELFAGV
ncbi:NmrA-like family protein [Xenococcus sp. PCC 7305]|uniref:SDR family oxidoreductase n=1 Tax=Xenococcus sp. PCC 7305 TaxID=102125 RepID=UPI0002AC3BEC|nr:SDR family oxidoreductase [Xenococcus sp. PCC 7305]ELS04177.1 NmrA-like family protein [Xenococcus sp. PCC 7305]